MPPSYVLTEDVLSSSFVLSERTAPLHKGGNSSASAIVTGSPNKSKKALRRRSVDFVLTTSSTSPDVASSSRLSDAAPDGKPPPKALVHEYDGPTPEEQEEVWYSRDEYDIIKARNNLIIKMMKGGTFKESDEHTFRGLEHKLKDGFKRRRANKFNALNAVLEVQDAQFARGRPDPDSIAEAYRLVSLSAKETAFVLGNRDAEESYCYERGPSSSPNKHRTGHKKKVASSSPGGRPRHSSLSDLLQHHHHHHHHHRHMSGTGPEGDDAEGPDGDDVNEADDTDDDNDDDIDDDDDSSTVNDVDTVNSESTAKRTSRLRSMFGAVSLKRREKINRRTSL